ncbi:MAG: Hsp20 family protein [Alphaproteobacteria bacterium]|nr:Hsp20 family protein [Alphaproteobacteria bacterium]
MRTYDLSPLLRATVGFDRVNSIFDSLARMDEGALSYPPYNIEKVEDNAYRVTMAVAGFSEADLDLTVQDQTLIVAGRGPQKENGQYLYRGIARRAFERRFELADHIHVAGAALRDGLLVIDLVREVPEAMKPRRVAIEVRPRERKELSQADQQAA